MLGDGNLRTAMLWEDKQLSFEEGALCQHNVQFLCSLPGSFTNLFSE